ncbi:Atu2307/SP_0267 family LLM class monooxygenase [uncultured Aquimarina sp.]|uniref:Atu2307/SP_0267 family LLM class monooxygenase n=1 Tax=uncultured Aquimarina sp. TaxID=575652 RepID=UPI0026044D19|nr:Atu2307/SP_0267 family LLM class monooxygenase [uncultured Aquimarina sp.]
MEIGIDSFAASPKGHEDSVKAIQELLERIELADQVGLDAFGIGEHYRKEFLDAAPTTILAAAAARTKNIRLTSAVTVLSTSDPVRVFQNFSTIDLISNGRAEIVAGRGSFVDSFPLFGYNLNDYDAIFSEKLELLLKIRDNEIVNWSGLFRPPLREQAIYPRPIQKKIPIWLGVGGTAASFARAGKLGLPLMVAVIGGQTHKFAPLVELYRKMGEEAGFSPEELKVGLHSFGYVANSREEAITDFYPRYIEVIASMNKERGWVAPTREQFEKQIDEQGAIVIGNPEEVAKKIIRHSKALGGISRFNFQMDVGLSHEQMKKSIELIGKEVVPLINSK